MNMKVAISCLLFVVFAFSANLSKVKIDSTITMAPETTKVIKCDTLLVVKHKVLTISSVLKDTTKVMKRDSTLSTKLDTLKKK